MSSNSTSGASPSMSAPSFDFDLNPILGPIFIGVICAATFYGFTTLQTILYYMNYPKDRIWLKSLVAAIWVLDTLSLAMLSYGAYTYCITNFLNPMVLEYVSWGIATEGVVSGLIALSVHLFFSYRIWGLNRKLAPWVGFLVLLALFDYAITLVASYYGVKDTADAEAELAVSDLHWTINAGLGSNLAVDVLITLTLCAQLYTHKIGFRRTDKMIDLLIMYTVTSGLISTLISIGGLVSNVAAPDTLIIEAFNAVRSKAYANALLATLNSRQSVANVSADSSELVPASRPHTTLQFQPPEKDPRDTTGTALSTIPGYSDYALSSTKIERTSSGRRTQHLASTEAGSIQELDPDIDQAV